jgi:hypothetical protein
MESAKPQHRTSGRAFLKRNTYLTQSPAGKPPQEPVESIINRLWWHFDSLFTWCLTYRASMTRTPQYHLFRRRRLIHEYQSRALAALRQHGLVDYARRIELDCDLLPLHINDSPTFWYLKDMGLVASLRTLAFAEYNFSHFPGSTRLVEAITSFVTLELVVRAGLSTSTLN